MGWDGYYQNFCKAGHYYASSAFAEDNNCPYCGELTAISNCVDDTNCDAVGVIPADSLQTLLITPDKVEICNLGHAHVMEKAVFRIPTEEELKSLQHYWDERTEEFKPLYKDKP